MFKLISLSLIVATQAIPDGGYVLINGHIGSGFKSGDLRKGKFGWSRSQTEEETKRTGAVSIWGTRDPRTGQLSPDT